MLKDSALPFTPTFPCKIKCEEEEENMGLFVHGHQMFFYVFLDMTFTLKMT